MSDSPVPVTETAAAEPAPPPPAAGHGRWIAAGAVLLATLSAASMMFAWNTQQRVKSLEAELVKRQQDSSGQAAEARVGSKAALELARETAAKLALLDARVAESSLQRSQLEDLIQQLARSRDENVLADVDAAIRVAMQQAAITGSADPLVATLRQADDRLARFNQPRLERVRRAVAQDLDKVRAAGVSDITLLTIRLDEVFRTVDDLPLQSAADKRAAAARAATATPPKPASAPSSWAGQAGERWRALLDHLWNEARSLVRVSRIDHPEAMLIAPEQAYFLRENLKLRLLNARLALLSRQFDTAQSDLRDAQMSLERYFERGHRRVAVAIEVTKQVGAQARQVTVPRPEATLAAIATTMASAGR